MAKAIDFYWDLGSTNSYFALHLIKPAAARHGASIAPHPFNLGHVFRKLNYVLMDEPKAKIANRITDLHRWVLELPDFADEPGRSNEKILEAIQAAWIEERD